MRSDFNDKTYEELEEEENAKKDNVICEVSLDPYLKDFNLNNIIKEALDKRQAITPANKKDMIRVYVEYMERGI